MKKKLIVASCICLAAFGSSKGVNAVESESTATVLSLSNKVIEPVDSFISVNLYEDLKVYYHAKDMPKFSKVVYQYSNGNILKEIEVQNNYFKKLPNDEFMYTAYFEPQNLGGTVIKTSFYDENNKIISESSVTVNVVIPREYIKAGSMDVLITPKASIYSGIKIKKFSQYNNPDNALRNINGFYKFDLIEISKRANADYKIINKNNVNEVIEFVNSLLMQDQETLKMDKSKLLTLHSSLTLLQNSYDNQVIDETLSRLSSTSKMGRSLTVDENSELQLIQSLSPSNTVLDNNIVNEPTKSARAFSDNNANNYAIKHATSPNHGSYVELGLDCTNFVSQVVKAGGRGMNSTWKYDKALGASSNYSTYAWKNADGFLKYYKSNYTSTNFKNFSYNVFSATAVVLDFTNDGKADHAGWVTADNSSYGTYTDQYGKSRTYMNFKVAQHTGDYNKWVNDNGNSWETYDGKGKYYVIYFL